MRVLALAGWYYKNGAVLVDNFSSEEKDAVSIGCKSWHKTAALQQVSWWANKLKRLVHQDTCGIFARLILVEPACSSVI